MIDLRCENCLTAIKNMPDMCIDLIVYFNDNTYLSRGEYDDYLDFDILRTSNYLYKVKELNNFE